MKRLEKRIQKLEEHDCQLGYAAAMQMLPDEDFAVLLPYLERWEAAGGERAPQPHPTPEEAEVLAKLNGLRRRALREGWGDSAYRIC